MTNMLECGMCLTVCLWDTGFLIFPQFKIIGARAFVSLRSQKAEMRTSTRRQGTGMV